MLAASGAGAIEIRAPAGAAADPFATLGAIACTRTGWCAAGGSYRDRGGHVLAMAAIESGRRWAQARRLAMPADAVPALFAGSQEVRSIWCSQQAACVAVGSYQTAVSSAGFVAAESGGTWTRALELRLPGNASSIAPGAVLGGVSCRGAGVCVAVGGYFDRSLAAEAMAAAASRGRWAPARQLPLPAGAAGDPGASLSSVWCPAAGACLAVGGYQTAALDRLGLAAAGSPGRWRAGRSRCPPTPRPARA